MPKLLIADRSEDFVYALEMTLRKEYEIRSCRDGQTALELLSTFRPDAMILGITLPVQDGFTVLQEAAYLPAVILGITDYMSDYISNRAMELGIGFLMISPSLNALQLRLADMVKKTQGKTRSKVSDHLDALGVPAHRDGYRQLCRGVSLFAQKPNQRLGKDLYPAIAKESGEWNAKAVEHGIRRAVEAAWESRDKVVWEHYFPGIQLCPSNKVFIAQLAELILKNT